jgi:phospholipase C
MHKGIIDSDPVPWGSRLEGSRRRFLQQLAAALGAGSLAAQFFPRTLRAASAIAPRNAATGNLPIKHVIIAVQENRSFDHYFGFAPFVGSFGVPTGYSQPDGLGGTVSPFHFTSLSSPDIGHSWSAMHSEWDSGSLDGFFTTDGINCMGFYTADDLPFYYSLFSEFTLCVNYFSSLLGPTYPNRLYLASRTCGGNTTNSIIPGSLNYPMILDVFEQFGITWKNYNIGSAERPPITDNALMLFSKWLNDPRQNFLERDYFNDLSNGTFPQVAFITSRFQTGGPTGLDEHPPANIQLGMNKQKDLITALRNSPFWSSSAYLLTYDESGGYFEHVTPPVFDAYGAGFRVPMWIISPFAKNSHLETTLYEHSSVLKFLEAVFGLPTLASINHEFDTQTPSTNNDAANGQPFGPAAPPRDGRTDIGDLTQAFNFT